MKALRQHADVKKGDVVRVRGGARGRGERSARSAGLFSRSTPSAILFSQR
jgi:hypothetical protein